MLALVFLVPHPAPGGLAIALLVLGASRGLGLLRQAARTPAPGGKGISVQDTLREVALPALASLGLLVVAVEVLRGEYVSLFGLVLVIAALLTTGSWHAWMLLVEPAACGGTQKRSGRAGALLDSERHPGGAVQPAPAKMGSRFVILPAPGRERMSAPEFCRTCPTVEPLLARR